MEPWVQILLAIAVVTLLFGSVPLLMVRFVPKEAAKEDPLTEAFKEIDEADLTLEKLWNAAYEKAVGSPPPSGITAANTFHSNEPVRPVEHLRVLAELELGFEESCANYIEYCKSCNHIMRLEWNSDRQLLEIVHKEGETYQEYRYPIKLTGGDSEDKETRLHEFIYQVQLSLNSAHLGIQYRVANVELSKTYKDMSIERKQISYGDSIFASIFEALDRGKKVELK